MHEAELFVCLGRKTAAIWELNLLKIKEQLKKLMRFFFKKLNFYALIKFSSFLYKLYVFIHIFVEGYLGVWAFFFFSLQHLVIQYANHAKFNYYTVHLHFFLLPEGIPP